MTCGLLFSLFVVVSSLSIEENQKYRVSLKEQCRKVLSIPAMSSTFKLGISCYCFILSHQDTP
jgi:hypothetical protein